MYETVTQTESVARAPRVPRGPSMRRLHVRPIGSLWPVVCLRPFVLSALPPGLSQLGKALAPVGQGAGPCRVCSHTIVGCGGETRSRQRPGRPGPLYRPTPHHRLKPRYPQAFLLRRTCSLDFSVTSTQGWAWKLGCQPELSFRPLEGQGGESCPSRILDPGSGTKRQVPRGNDTGFLGLL